MIKYHGTPITPKKVFLSSMKHRNVLIPFTHKQDLKKAIEICDKILIDNGAYTVWRQKICINWSDYYDWIDSIYNHIDFFFIPDVIDGTEKENDKLKKHVGMESVTHEMRLKDEHTHNASTINSYKEPIQEEVIIECLDGTTLYNYIMEMDTDENRITNIKYPKDYSISFSEYDALKLILKGKINISRRNE